MCWPGNATGAPLNKRNWYVPDNLPKAITEPLKVIAPMAAPRTARADCPADRVALGLTIEGSRLGHRRHGNEHRRQADHAVEEDHQLRHLRHLDVLAR